MWSGWLTINSKRCFSGQFLNGIGNCATVFQCNLRYGQFVGATSDFNRVSENRHVIMVDCNIWIVMSKFKIFQLIVRICPQYYLFVFGVISLPRCFHFPSLRSGLESSHVNVTVSFSMASMFFKGVSISTTFSVKTERKRLRGRICEFNINVVHMKHFLYSYSVIPITLTLHLECLGFVSWTSTE